MEKIKTTLIISVLFSLTSCYKQLNIEGFDKEQWAKQEACSSTYRLDAVNLITENEEVLLQATQNEIESILGKAEEHELYQRNQKFFHYRLTPADSCGNYETIQYLSIRFNAIGRANLVQVMLREAS